MDLGCALLENPRPHRRLFKTMTVRVYYPLLYDFALTGIVTGIGVGVGENVRIYFGTALGRPLG